MSPEHKDLLRKVAEFLLRTSFKRVLSTMIVLGVTLLGLSWTDIAGFLLQAVGRPGEAGAFVTFAQVTGLGMIVVGFVGHLTLYISERRAERRAAAAKERSAAAQLVGRIQVLVRGFHDPAVVRDAGYYNEEIVQCGNAARQFLDQAPLTFAADLVVAALVNPKIDASKRKPYFDLELSDLESLVARVKAHYEIK